MFSMLCGNQNWQIKYIKLFQISTQSISSQYLSSGIRLCQLKLSEHILAKGTFTLCSICEHSAVQLAELCRLFPVRCSMLILSSLTVSLAWTTQKQQLACFSRELADGFRQGDWCYSHLEQLAAN